MKAGLFPPFKWRNMIAILGTGSIAHSHVNAIRCAGKEVGLVVNPHVEAAKTFAENYGIKKYSAEFDELLSDEVETVHICTPANLHYEEVKALLFAGKNVLCEKPLCLSFAESKELAEISSKLDSVTAIDLNVRYNPACRSAKEMVQSDDFGALMLMHGEYLQEFELLPTAYTWRYDEKKAGKMRAVTEIGSHLVDLMYFVSGQKIVRLSACFNRIQKDRVIKDGMMYDASIESGDEFKVDSEDSALVTYQLENGVFGSFVLSEVSSGHMNTIKLELAGSKKDVSWNSDEATKLNFASKGNPVNTINFAFGNNGFNDSIIELVKDFYMSVDGKESSNVLPSFEDGAYLSRICEAIYESAHNDAKWVKI